MSAKPTAFADLSLHPLLLRALSTLQFPVPTPIQATLIPIALESSRDVLARARTGSGKTLAYAIPIVQGILQRRDQSKKDGTKMEGTRALVLVPTRELAEQVRGQIGKLVDGLGLGESEGEGIRVVNVVGESGGKKKRKTAGGERVERYVLVFLDLCQRPQYSSSFSHRLALADRPEIVVATPSRALAHLRSEVRSFSIYSATSTHPSLPQTLHLEHLDYLVIDEADLILSYGHSSEDIRSILSGPWNLPTLYQSFLMSATLTGEVEELKGVVLKNPVRLPTSSSSLSSGLSFLYRSC